MQIAQIPFADTRGTGYKFLSPVRGKYNTVHPGLDMNQGNSANADLGLPVMAMAAGNVIFSRYEGAGWGNLVYIEHPGLYEYSPTGYVASRCAHFKEVKVKEGDVVDLSTIIGTCGKSGTTAVHLHWEVVLQRLPSFTHYPNGKGREYVNQRWANPIQFVEQTNQKFMSDNNLIPDYAKPDWDESQEMQGFPFKNPNQELDVMQFQEVLKFHGIFTSVGKMPAYRANFAAKKIKRLIEG